MKKINLKDVDLTNKYQILNYLNQTGLVKIYDFIKDERLLKDKDILLSCIENDVRFFNKVPDEFIADKDFALKMFLYNPLLMQYIKHNYPDYDLLIQDEDITNICVHLNGINLLYSSNNQLKNDVKYYRMSWDRSNIYSRALLIINQDNKNNLKKDWFNIDVELSDTWRSHLKKHPNEKSYKFPLKNNNYESIEKTLSMPKISGVETSLYENKKSMLNTIKTSQTKKLLDNFKF